MDLMRVLAALKRKASEIQSEAYIGKKTKIDNASVNKETLNNVQAVIKEKNQAPSVDTIELEAWLKTVQDFDILEEFSSLKPAITLSQLLATSPSLRKQVSKALNQRTARSVVDVKGVNKVNILNDREASSKETLIKGMIMNEPVTITLDGGSMTNLITKDLVDRLGLAYDESSRFIVEVADANLVKPLGEMKDLAFQVSDMNFNINALVMSKGSYEIILGKPWLASLNAFTSWKDDITVVDYFGDWKILQKEDDSTIKLREEKAHIKQITIQELDEDLKDLEVVQVFLIDIREILEEDLPSYADELDPRVKELITEYDDIFSKDEFDLGRYNGPSHRITTVTKQPLHQKHYRASPRENEAIKKEIDRLLSIGAITPSTAPWSSPVILVKKKDDDLRMCCDYRRLNSITVTRCL